MQVITRVDGSVPLADVATAAREAEDLGFSGLHISETVHDPFMVAALAIANSQRLIVRTSVALAFVRSPLLSAYEAWDLSTMSGGRFHLGLGTQIKQNIEDRYGMPWGRPVQRMSEYIEVLERLFKCFRTGEAPDFVGDHYKATRLQPHFNPGPDIATQTPPVWLGGVNPRMCELAGAKADGFMAHSTNSHPRYLEQICLPSIARGSASVDRPPDSIEVIAGLSFIVAADEEGLAREREEQRRRFAFLYSTPAYKATLELCGFPGLQTELQDLVKSDRWEDLGSVVPDSVLDEILPSSTYHDLAELIETRFAGLVDGIVLPPPSGPPHREQFRDLLAKVRAIPERRSVSFAGHVRHAHDGDMP